MKHFTLIIITFFLATVAQSQQVLSLKHAIETGIKNNLEVSQAGLQSQRSEINWKQSKAFMLPDLNAFLNHGLNQGRSIDPFTNGFINQNVTYANYGASTNLLLYNGSSLHHKIEQTKLAFEASQKELQQAKDNLTINIILTYLQVLSSEDVLEQSSKQIIVSNQQVSRLKILNNEGAIAPSLLYDLKGQVANDQLTVADNEAALANAKLNLGQLLNIPYDKNLEVEKISMDDFHAEYDKTPEEIYQVALKNFAMIKSVHLRTESAESAVKSARGELFPTLSLGGAINSNYSNAASQSFFQNNTETVSTDYVNVNGEQLPIVKTQPVFDVKKIPFSNQLSNNLFSSVSLNLAIPLFNANQTRNKIRFAKIDLENNRLIEKNSKNELQQSIEKAFVELTNAKSRFDILQGQVKAFSESFRAAEIRFNAGDITSVDYLVAKNNYDRSQINLIISKYDFVLRKKVLDFYEGNQLQ